MAEKLRFIYVPTGYALPSSTNMDANAIYFGEDAQELWVHKHRIANYVDSSDILGTVRSEYKVKDLGNPVDDGSSQTNTFVSDAEIDSNGKLIFHYEEATFEIIIGNPEYSQQSEVVSPVSNSVDVITDLHASGESITPVVTTVEFEGFASSEDVDDALDEAKQYTDNAVSGLTGVMHFLGVSSTVISDGQAQIPTIDGSQVTPHTGDVVIYGDGEFVWDGSKWNELGTASSFALKTQRIIAGTGLSGGGQLSSDVTLNHAVAKIASFDRLEQVVSTDGHASDWDGVSPDGDIRLSLIRQATVDSLGHVTSVQYQDITSYLVQLMKYISGTVVDGAIEGTIADNIEDAMEDAVAEANAYTDTAIEDAGGTLGSAKWAVEVGVGGSNSSNSGQASS